MAKSLIREFKLADRDALHPCLNERGAFVGDDAALLTKDNFGDFAPLPRRELETVLSAAIKLLSILARGRRGWQHLPRL